MAGIHMKTMPQAIEFNAFYYELMAVREGFEPSIRCRIHTFQACAFDHSATSPLRARMIPQDTGVSSPPLYWRLILGRGTAVGSVLRNGLISSPPRRV